MPHWEDAQDLSKLVRDKRSGKRANSAKGRRRNRRYENRLLSAQLEQAQLEQTDFADVNGLERLDEPPDKKEESLTCSDSSIRDLFPTVEDAGGP